MRTRIVKETDSGGRERYRCERCFSPFFGLFGLWETWETMTYHIPRDLGDGVFYAVFDTEKEARDFLQPYRKEIVQVYGG